MQTIYVFWRTGRYVVQAQHCKVCSYISLECPTAVIIILSIAHIRFGSTGSNRLSRFAPSQTSLWEGWILRRWQWRFPKAPLAFLRDKVWRHRQRQSKLILEELLRREFALMQAQSLASTFLEKFAFFYHQSTQLTILSTIWIRRANQETKKGRSHKRRQVGSVEPRAQLSIGSRNNSSHENAVKGWQDWCH